MRFLSEKVNGEVLYVDVVAHRHVVVADDFDEKKTTVSKWCLRSSTKYWYGLGA